MQDMSNISEQAKAHGRAIGRFYMWAEPLHEAGHITLIKNSVNLDLVISKRFMVGRNKNGRPTLEAQAAEMVWLKELPLISAGANIESKRIYLFARPADPFKDFIITIPVDSGEKIKHYLNHDRLDIHFMEKDGGLFKASAEPYFSLPLTVAPTGKAGSRKLKNNP